jgi:hypothetical protein
LRDDGRGGIGVPVVSGDVEAVGCMVIGFFVELVVPWPLFMVITTKYRGNQLTAGVLRGCSPA